MFVVFLAFYIVSIENTVANVAGKKDVDILKTGLFWMHTISDYT